MGLFKYKNTEGLRPCFFEKPMGSRRRKVCRKRRASQKGDQPVSLQVEQLGRHGCGTLDVLLATGWI